MHKWFRIQMLTVALAVVLAPQANAGQYQHGSVWANWTMPSTVFTNWEQDIVVTDTASDTFWTIFWTKIYGPDGYLGIQTPGGVNKFHFSMWGATGSIAPVGTTCSNFTEKGNYGYTTGRQCQTPVGASIENRKIRLKLIKSNRTNDADRWWSAWADIEGVGGKYLGQLQAPHVGWLQTASNFHEFFGEGNGWNKTTKTCVPPGPPSSAAVFGGPTVSSPTLSPRKLVLSGTGEYDCAGAVGEAVPFGDGAFTRLGDV